MTSPFLIYSLPGSSAVHKLAFSETKGDTLRFGKAIVRPWPMSDLNSCGCLLRESTPKEIYVKRVCGLIEKLKETGNKTVIARNICGRFSRFVPFEMAEKYFSIFPDMFCFMFYHPYSGWWMGASPELLLETSDNLVFKSRALAGTIPADSTDDWNSKNLREHNMVIDDITSKVRALGKNYIVSSGKTGEFRYKNIKHLCTPIRISSLDGEKAFERIVDVIHPTAAVCGLPTSSAMDDISVVETEPRKFYSGYIAVPDDEESGKIAYVILRCVNFDEKSWCVYTGSGITGDSEAVDEWFETEIKAKPLVDILSLYSK